MKNKLVREAVAYAVNKNAIVQILGGKAIGSATSQLILPGNVGYIPNYNPFPDNNGAATRPRPSSCWPRRHQTGRRDEAAVLDHRPDAARGPGAAVQPGRGRLQGHPGTGHASSDFYGKYLENPTTGKRDVWDIAPPGWVPDWFGNNGRSTIVPLLTQPGPGSNDFGGYTSSTVQQLHQRGAGGTRAAAATTDWQRPTRRP